MTILFLIFAVAGLLWSGVLMLRGGLLAGCLVVLLAGSCFGHAFYHVPMKPIPVTADRALLLALAVQFVAFYKLKLIDPKRWTTAEYLLVGFMAVLAISTVTHDWAADNNRPASTYVFSYVMPFAMYWIARQAVITSWDIRIIFGTLAIFGVYLSFTAWAEVQQYWALVHPSYIGSDAVAEYFGRGRGPFLNPTGCGMIITLCLCAALTAWPRASVHRRWLIIGMVLLCGVGTYYTLTRSVWLGAALALLIMAAAGATRRSRVALLAGSAALAAALLVTQWDSLTRFKRDRDVTVADMTESAELRPLLAAVSWEMFLDRPLFGCGFGQYGDAKNSYLSDRSGGLNLEKTRPYVQHNVFLALLTETGLVGAGLFVILLATWASAAWRLCRNGHASLGERQVGLVFLTFLAAYIANGMFHDMAVVPSLHMFFFFIAGLTSGVAATHPRNAIGHSPPEVAQFSPTHGDGALEPLIKSSPEHSSLDSAQSPR